MWYFVVQFVLNQRKHRFKMTDKMTLENYLLPYKAKRDFARAMGVSQAQVGHWIKAGGQMTAERARQAEKVTGGILHRATLCKSFAE